MDADPAIGAHELCTRSAPGVLYTRHKYKQNHKASIQARSSRKSETHLVMEEGGLLCFIGHPRGRGVLLGNLQIGTELGGTPGG